jgi:hypothetical protein
VRQEELADLLQVQGIQLDEATLAAVLRWREAWLKEWDHVHRLALGDEDLPAPLWCWPP